MTTFTESIYSAWMKETQQRKYEDIFLDFIVPSMATLELKKAMMLDVGVGDGWFEAFLKGKGIDPKLSVGVDSVMHKPLSAFVLSDGNFLPFRNGTFDIVVSFDTVHLIQNVHELVRVIRKNGFLLISDFCNQYSMEGKRSRMLKNFDEMKLLKEGLVGDEREIDYVALFQKI